MGEMSNDFNTYLQEAMAKASMQTDLIKAEVREMENFFKGADRETLDNFVAVLGAVARSENPGSHANYWRGYVEGILLVVHGRSLLGDDEFDPTGLLG
jgi:hypothetical protein